MRLNGISVLRKQDNCVHVLPPLLDGEFEALEILWPPGIRLCAFGADMTAGQTVHTAQAGRMHMHKAAQDEYRPARCFCRLRIFEHHDHVPSTISAC